MIYDIVYWIAFILFLAFIPLKVWKVVFIIVLIPIAIVLLPLWLLCALVTDVYLRIKSRVRYTK